MASLKENPWGRPYKLVVEKLSTWAPPITESFEPQILKGVVDTLFPKPGDGAPPPFT